MPAPCKSVALDPDQFLDDIVNRLKFGEAALGNDAMRRTIGLFRHENRQGIEAYDRRNERDGSKTRGVLRHEGVNRRTACLVPTS